MTGLAPVQTKIERDHWKARRKAEASLLDDDRPERQFRPGETPKAYYARLKLQVAECMATWDAAYPCGFKRERTLAQMVAEQANSPWLRSL